jgi:hypothetical protein
MVKQNHSGLKIRLEYLVFFSWVAIVSFQEFLNYILPIPLRIFEFFLATILFAKILFKTDHFTHLRFNIFTFITICLTIYGSFILLLDFSLSHSKFFLYFILPLLVYSYTIENKIKFDQKYYSTLYFFLFIIGLFGFYEAIFANYILADIVVNKGAVSQDHALKGLYLQKVNTAVPFYRPVSFIMEFVYYSYFCLAFVYISFLHYSFTKNILHFGLFVFSIILLASTLSISAIFSAVVSFFLLFFTKSLIAGKIKIIIISIVVISITLIIVLKIGEVYDIAIFSRLILFLEGKDIQAESHFRNSIDYFSFSIFGSSWSDQAYEHEFLDSIHRIGFMAIGYFVFYILIFINILKYILLKNKDSMLFYPIFLMLVSLFIIGFVHHSFSATSLTAIFLFIFATIENKAKLPQDQQ